MRKIRHILSIFSLQSYNSLKMNNLHNIIATKDIYFIYIGENISKKLINKIVVRCSKRVVTNFCLNCCITMI